MQTMCKTHLCWTLNTQPLCTLYSRCDVESQQVKNFQNWNQKLANLRWDVLTSNRSAYYWKMPDAGILSAGFGKKKKKTLCRNHPASSPRDQPIEVHCVLIVLAVESLELWYYYYFLISHTNMTCSLMTNCKGRVGFDLISVCQVHRTFNALVSHIHKHNVIHNL